MVAAQDARGQVRTDRSLKEERIVLFLADNPASSLKDIKRGTGILSPFARVHLKRLRGRGVVRAEKRKGRTVYDVDMGDLDAAAPARVAGATGYV